MVVVGDVLREGSGETIKVVAALSVTLGPLKVRQGNKDHQEDQAGDSQHEHDFDDGEAFFRFSIGFFHVFLS